MSLSPDFVKFGDKIAKSTGFSEFLSPDFVEFGDEMTKSGHSRVKGPSCVGRRTAHSALGRRKVNHVEEKARE